MLCCLCLLLHPCASQDPPTRAGCTSTLLTGRDCAMARGKLPWNTFTLPGVLSGLDLQEKFGLSAEILWNIFAPFLWDAGVPGRNTGPLQLPQRLCHMPTFCWCSSQAPSCLHWIFKGIFFGNAGLSSRMLKGWEGSKENLGAACCRAGFCHHQEPTEGFAAEHLRLCPASHLSTLPLSPHLGAVFFQFSVTKKMPGMLCIC